MLIPMGIVVGAGIAGLFARSLYKKKKRVFVSYYFEGDNHYKRLLQAWSANKKFELNFDDISTDVSINSENEKYIKNKISGRIQQCHVFVVIVGKKTHKRSWVTWEITKALEFGKKIVAIKEKKSHSSPKELLSVGAEWVYGFNEEKIRKAIQGWG